MNQQLQEELLSMKEADQCLLKALIDNGQLNDTDYHPRMKELHEKNNARIKQIIDEYGWPGISMVGKEGSKAAWLLIQHAVLDVTFMENTLKLLRSAVEQGEADAWCLAYLQDRVLTMTGQPQIYGTQHDFDEMGRAFPLPIAEPDRVDALRESVGLGPLYEATQRIQETYRPATWPSD